MRGPISDGEYYSIWVVLPLRRELLRHRKIVLSFAFLRKIAALNRFSSVSIEPSQSALEELLQNLLG
jgi:hypothetical protein